MKSYLIKFLLFAISILFLVNNASSQSKSSDSIFHPYHVNYWITGGIIIVGGTVNFMGSTKTTDKEKISQTEINSLNKDVINGFDKIALEQSGASRNVLTNLSNNLLTGIVALPGFLLFDKGVRHDWLDILLMYAETMSITTNIYEYSFIGPNFIQRFRPVTYYESMPMDKRTAGENRCSFYSGHTATTTAATFFAVKVYSDYHPEIGNDKYWLYAAASIPPLIEGYIRIKALYHFPSDVIIGYCMGAMCGIVIPEFHRFQDKNISLGLYSSFESTGVTVKWQPDFYK